MMRATKVDSKPPQARNAALIAKRAQCIPLQLSTVFVKKKLPEQLCLHCYVVSTHPDELVLKPPPKKILDPPMNGYCLLDWNSNPMFYANPLLQKNIQFDIN